MDEVDAAAVKLTLETLLLPIVTGLFDGVKVYPEALGVTTYAPAFSPEKLYCPDEFAVVATLFGVSVIVNPALPDAGGVMVPEMLYVEGEEDEATSTVTVTVLGECCAPGAVTVTCPVYVPGEAPLRENVRCSVLAPVPLAGVTVSHDESPEAVKFNVPEPLLVTLTVADAGFDPCVALSVMVLGEADNVRGCE